VSSYKIPGVLFVAAVAGLVLALWSDGWMDAVACLLLAVPVVVLTGKLRQPAA
jgi:hypothetical protein